MSDDLPRQLERANELVTLGRDAQALDLLLRLARTHPDRIGPIEISLARAHLVAGRPEEGRQAALRAIGADPAAYGGHLLLGFALHLLDRPAEAVAPLQEAARLDRHDAEPLLRLAQVLTDLHRLDEAYAAAGEGLRREPHSAKAHFSMGYVLHETNPAEADRAYRKALELNPQHVGAKHNLAGVSVQRGDWAAGSKGMAAVLAANPQANTPVFVLDQRVVDVIRWLHWLMFGGWIGYGLASSIHPIAPFVWLGLLVAGAALIIRKGTEPIRRALPQGGGRFFAGFPRREVIATIWLGLLAVAWLWLFGCAVAGVLAHPDARWAGVGTIAFLLVAAVLSWVRVPEAKARAERLRRGAK